MIQSYWSWALVMTNVHGVRSRPPNQGWYHQLNATFANHFRPATIDPNSGQNLYQFPVLTSSFVHVANSFCHTAAMNAVEHLSRNLRGNMILQISTTNRRSCLTVASSPMES
ncbi:uncharacterized protein BYT42DRAFT_182687 [Radiomyces spectabilis]|uniref:uncharacterized protein n=1 Tax=Radiomyces spectabilis TaxID=64574 RepID=UPI00221E7D04|nr:uncharacterized protein BYT42DRAFT_182687 [Radiomyces spectabilis]KAI8391123.1 hypothetical protein BYT42DRAFT_182687 [Radiomyces spectabilis]